MVWRAAARYSARTPRTPSDSRALVNVTTSGASSVSKRCWIISEIRARSCGTESLLRR
ncbi:Uncharacterised protein [Mycobacterium tuberculosis]|uniref:Uncharacterized protein n=1 Tax=Mycobacterium tuberculosis TaxID=1773 RepID=A0A654U5E5_MYCTX|nr:Uncharacterised protein [Mycobacterium tuberculosis]CFS62248.1 Uncharacterised protein [Mycobacterium tuberculosis]CNL73354.1 Uncharacterised protein [Mycobacterium tuberculosis]